METKSVYIPQYMKNFRCIGAACEETCCRGWNVHLDKATYEKYMGYQGKLSEKIKGSIKSIDENKRNNFSYGYIEMGADKRCPFLDEKGWCIIHSTVGEKYLSNTCNTYPRMLNKINGRFEMTANISCPEAARMILFGTEKIILSEEESTKYMHGSLSLYKIVETKKSGIGFLYYFEEIRNLTLKILQTREIDITDRLLLLGLFTKKIDECSLGEKEGEIPNIIKEYEEIMANGNIRNISKEIGRNLEVQLYLIKEICEIKGGFDSDYKKILDKIITGIGFDNEKSRKENSDNYQKNYFNYMRKYLKNREELFENYLVNYVLKNLYPVTDENNIFELYSYLVVNYALIKFHITGMAAYNGAIDDKLVTEVFYTYSKIIEHNSAFLKGIYTLLKGREFLTMPYMFMLMKN